MVHTQGLKKAESSDVVSLKLMNHSNLANFSKARSFERLSRALSGGSVPRLQRSAPASSVVEGFFLSALLGNLTKHSSGRPGPTKKKNFKS